MEGDAAIDAVNSYLKISTHALTWRATLFVQVFDLHREFLPTPSHGGRHTAPISVKGEVDFYPRPHMEGDLIRQAKYSVVADFYPRPHMEGDVAPPPVGLTAS